MPYTLKRERRCNTKLFLLLTASIMFSLASCSMEKRIADPLYDVDSLIQTQIKYLKVYKASIEKRALLDGVQNVTTITPKDSTDWIEELAIFLELSVINKPSNKTYYKIEETLDDRSNLNVRSFISTDELPVTFLKLYYYRSLDQLRKVEAQYSEANALYKSTRFLTMEFEQIFNKTLLTSYAVAGGQKMFLDDSVQYSIRANIAVKEN
jgi:hypothetical protein